MISLVLPTSKINGTLTKQVDQIKFLGVIFDEKVAVSWTFSHCSACASLKIWWIIMHEY